MLIHTCKYTHSHTCTLANKYAYLHMCAFKYRRRDRASGPLLYNVTKKYHIVLRGH